MTTRAPVIWLLAGDKLGDNAQLGKIVAHLGLPYTHKRLVPKPAFTQGKPRFAASLEHLDAAQSDPLQPPWPDLVITAGRRHAMAALWIKEQHPATRLVLLGRARRWIERFDLVITLPQYQLPALPNVMRLSLPLMRPDKAAIAQHSEQWRARFDALPKPLIAVMIGGPTRPYRFDATVIETLLVRCRDIQQRYGGTLYFSTSRRTPAPLVAALDAQRPPQSVLHQWRQGATDNPYLALLGSANYFIVSADSVSMMVEVAACGKPLAVFPLPSDRHGRLWQRLLMHLHDDRQPGGGHWLGRWLYRRGIAGFGRDLNLVYRTLAENGFAVAAGQAFVQPTRQLPDELDAISARIRHLIDTAPG